MPCDRPEGTTTKNLTIAGTLSLDQVQHMLGTTHGLVQVLIVTDGDQITVADLDGEILAELTRPGPGVTYVGKGRRPGQRHPEPRTVTEVLRHQPSPMS